mmetsp:Transcript_12842/g.35033  ORF Transcript_12842/g.35033 Transcript_12842/m.35033 type:complete len:104 (+) Transcript_12842:937-1248(+)
MAVHGRQFFKGSKIGSSSCGGCCSFVPGAEAEGRCSKWDISARATAAALRNLCIEACKSRARLILAGGVRELSAAVSVQWTPRCSCVSRQNRLCMHSAFACQR